MKTKVLVNIQNKYTSFSLKEKKIADYIMSNYSTMHNINIVNLAEKTGTSNATITRFCKKIGCNSFVEMKLGLSAANYKSVDSDESNVFYTVHSYYQTVISRTQEIIDKKQINILIDKLKSSKRVYVYGVGSSGLSSIEMKYRLQRMGIDIDSITDSHMMIMSSVLVKANDLVIGISNSGTTQEVVKALNGARKNGAFTVAITNFNDTPLTDTADLKLITYNSKFIGENSFINTQLSITYLLDVISIILLEDKELSRQRQKTFDAIQDILNRPL